MQTPILSPRRDAEERGTERALRLIRKIEERYGLPSPAAAPTPAADAADLSDSALYSAQMLVNEALVAKIFQCERDELALREAQQNLHDLLIHQLQLKEEERKRISLEIHDALGQNLLALRLDVATLSQVAGQNPRLADWVGGALSNIDSAIVTVRTLIAALRPFEIELGLEAAIEYELSQFRRTSGIACHLGFDAQASTLHLSDQQILTVYRALQECLSNVSRHSRASRVDVVVRVFDGTLTMVVSDNGVGLQRGNRGKSGYGLQAVRERLSSIGGKVALKSVRSHGTSVAVSIPLAVPEAATAVALSDKMPT
jgi:signal transduction histidine kinase